MSDDTAQRSVRSRVSRRTFAGRLLGAAGTALALGSYGWTAPSALAASPLAAPPAVAPDFDAAARAQAGGGTRVLLATDFDEIRARIAAPGWALDAFNALERSADGLVGNRPPIPDRGGGWFHAGGEGYEVTRVHNRLAEGTRTLEPDAARGGLGRPRIGRSRPWAGGIERVRPNMAVPW